MKKRLLLLMTISTLSGYTQETLIRKDGQQIKISENGTWSYLKSITKSNDNDCAKYIEVITNSASGLTSTRAIDLLKFSNDNEKTGLSILLMNSKDNNTTILSITAIEKACIVESNLLSIIFSNGSSIQIISHGRANCEGRSTIYFGESIGNNENLPKLTTLKIDTIMIATTTGIIKYRFSDKEAQTFKNTLSCLTNARMKN